MNLYTVIIVAGDTKQVIYCQAFTPSGAAEQALYPQAGDAIVVAILAGWVPTLRSDYTPGSKPRT